MTHDDSPRTVAGAVARGGLLLLRDLLLNGGVLMALLVGVLGAVSRAQPWVWLGPLVGVVGVAISFAAHRERVVRGPDGRAARRALLPAPAIWLIAVVVPLACLAMLSMMAATLL